MGELSCSQLRIPCYVVGLLDHLARSIKKTLMGFKKEIGKTNFGGYKLFREGHVQKIYISSSDSVSV